MLDRLEDRIIYGRTIRERARCLIEAHGTEAVRVAEGASRDPGLTASERAFWEVVAGRVGRLCGEAGSPLCSEPLPEAVER